MSASLEAQGAFAYGSRPVLRDVSLTIQASKFVGLVVPHIVHLVIRPKHSRLLPASVLAGATFLVLTDILARTLQRPEELMLGILTAILGAPFFLYMLLRHQRTVSIG